MAAAAAAANAALNQHGVAAAAPASVGLEGCTPGLHGTMISGVRPQRPFPPCYRRTAYILQ